MKDARETLLLLLKWYVDRVFCHVSKKKSGEFLVEFKLKIISVERFEITCMFPLRA